MARFGATGKSRNLDQGVILYDSRAETGQITMLNPIHYAERVVSDFLRYQLTTYPFADAGLHARMRRLLSLEATRATPLLKGPYVSLSPAFREGPSVFDLVAADVLHPHLPNIALFDRVYGHQETAIRAIAGGRTTVVSTGTGSGKTECFLYPIISKCLTLRDEGAAPGICAVIVYPMNALAEDQLGRLRDLLAGTGITFGMYIGKTPEKEADVTGVRLDPGASRADYRAKVEQFRQQNQNLAVHPAEERVTRFEMRTPGQQPRVLLTNVKQLELLLTRHQDVELFQGARLDYLVFDEAHTFSGAGGAETACLIRRLRTYCGRSAEDTVCVATSATIAGRDGSADPARRFASRFFGVRPDLVEVVREEYQPDLWAHNRTASAPLPGAPAVQLETVLTAVEAVQQETPAPAELRLLKNTFQAMTGEVLDVSRWQESLYERLAANEVLYQLAESLRSPKPLAGLVQDLARRIGRPVPEEEVLAWLALGAASRKNSRPLLRPVVHAFVRGVGGAVATFPPDADGPRLWLSAEDVAGHAGDGYFRLPIMTCTTCGQHYFSYSVRDFRFTDRVPGGGEACGNSVVWRTLDEALGGSRVVLLDKLVLDDDHNAAGTAPPPRNTAPVWFCRHCGALHAADQGRCGACGQDGPFVRLLAVRQKGNHPGSLTSCLGCGAIGHAQLGRYREPARPVRAVAVADVHVLAQSMLHHADRKRLLVFADNRQDAAFQAGWMQDHARRFRLRALMFEKLAAGPISIGDLVAWLDAALDADDDLSRSLAPEVWRAARKQSSGQQHAEQRRHFLRIHVLREAATGIRQRLGLEPWGRMRTEYDGLVATQSFFGTWSAAAGCTAAELRDGVACLLDVARRNRILLDRDGKIFSRFWHESDREIQRGYMPLIRGGPKALKLRRSQNDDASRLTQWLSARAQTAARQSVARWGVPANDLDRFFDELWTMLTDELHLLEPVTLTGHRNRPLPGCLGGRQIDADKLVLVPARGLYRCGVCRRSHARPTPSMACTGFRCQGTLVFEPEDPDNFDLMLLDQKYAMIRPREHSAQIPAADREQIERQFKGAGERLNTLVATPTLELGVDIGSLDSVLMRNVPPRASNYWQRAGRAGRRHRMAVDITYARPASHDRAYFGDPLKMLNGAILPPSFNLKNDVMVRKHVHATVLTVLHRLAHDQRLSRSERAEISIALKTVFPGQVRAYLFDVAGNVRSTIFDLTPLSNLIARYEQRIAAHVENVFTKSWPVEDADVVDVGQLREYIDGVAEQLAEVIDRLRRRLQWALDQMDRLDRVRAQQGTLGPEEDALRQRCDRLVKRLKGLAQRRRQEAEGYDDTNTYAVLAAEGFLPGYGLDTGWVVGYHQAPLFTTDLRDWELRRNPSLALREYIPGNLIYANGHRFIPRFFHLEPVEPALFQLDVANGAVVEAAGGPSATSGSLGTAAIRAVPVCDVDLPHNSQISDDEDYRFQLSVAVFGYELPRHGGGKAYSWGPSTVAHRAGVHLRLVNVGPAALANTGQLGYPVCLVCGQSRSPLASQADLANFVQEHQGRCGRVVDNVGFYATVVADSLSIAAENREEAYSVAEALRRGAAEVLEMEVEDLQVLAMGRAGDQRVDILLYDPMPGGSGLLDQMIARWGEVVAAALNLVANCESQCQTACVDCLLHFRNAYYHRHLNRHTALNRLRGWGDALAVSHDIPPRLPAQPLAALPVNDAEETLRLMLERAGFHGFRCQHRIELGRPLGATAPDFYFDDPSAHFDGVCIYLDGMSGQLHGNEDTRRRDRQIREELRSRFYEVIEIPFGNLTDREAMRRHFFRLGRILLGRDSANRLRDDASWFEARPGSAESPTADPWQECIELLSPEWLPLAEGLRAAGVPAPTDVDWDVPAGDLVGDTRAVMVWLMGDDFIALAAPQGAAEDDRIVRVTPQSPPAEVAAVLFEKIGGQV